MLGRTEKSVFSMSSKSMLGLWSMSMGSERPVSWEQTEQLYISVMHQGTREYLLTIALMSMLDSDSDTPMVPGKLEPDTPQILWRSLTQHFRICYSVSSHARFSYLSFCNLQVLSSHLEHNLKLKC